LQSDFSQTKSPPNPAEKWPCVSLP
jgi:hypothetical protein